MDNWKCTLCSNGQVCNKDANKLFNKLPIFVRKLVCSQAYISVTCVEDNDCLVCDEHFWTTE